MKKLFCLLLFAALGLTGYAQNGSVNGCTDARRSNGNWSTYWTIMNNPSISSEYKAAYEEGWRKCLSSSNWKIKNGKLVYEGEPDYGSPTYPKPGTPWVRTIQDVQGDTENN